MRRLPGLMATLLQLVKCEGIHIGHSSRPLLCGCPASERSSDKSSTCLQRHMPSPLRSAASSDSQNQGFINLTPMAAAKKKPGVQNFRYIFNACVKEEPVLQRDISQLEKRSSAQNLDWRPILFNSIKTVHRIQGMIEIECIVLPDIPSFASLVLKLDSRQRVVCRFSI
ncbi:hypothetical protein WAI453_001472 [Rhynchosporium graminicola]